MLVGSNEKLGEGENSGAIYLVDGRGNDADDPILPGWPITMTSLQLFPLVAEGISQLGCHRNVRGHTGDGDARQRNPPADSPGRPG